MWYSTGTCTVTNGSPTVTGSGTSWVGTIDAGWGLVAPDGKVYEVLSVDSATQITLAKNYAGSNASGQAYSLFPTQGLVRALTTQVLQLINDYAAVAAGPGAGKFSAGTAALPGVAASTDLDTGIAWLAANVLGISTGAQERVRFDGSGRIGQRVSAPEYYYDIRAISFASSQAPQGVAIRGTASADLSGAGWLGGLFMESNAGGQNSISLYGPNATTAGANTMQKAVEVFGSGATQDVNIYAGGALLATFDGVSSRLGIGTSSPTYKLDVAGEAGLDGNLSFGADDCRIRLETADGADNQRLSIMAANGLGSSRSAYMQVYGNEHATNPGALILSSGSTGFASIAAGGAERMRIDGSGSVGINTTAPVQKLTIGRLGGAPIAPTGGYSSLSVLSTDPGGGVAGSGSGITIMSGNAGESALYFGDPDDADVGSLRYLHASDELMFTAGALERMRINSNGRLLIGTTAHRTLDSVNAQLQVEGVGTSSAASLSLTSNRNDPFCAYLTLAKSRGTANGSVAAVQDGDNLGIMRFMGSDGATDRVGAQIVASVDGTPGSGDMPTRLVFSTTSDGNSGPSERLRIDNVGNMTFLAPTTPPSLTINRQMVFNLTSNTNLRISVRGADGVTRTANITLS